MLKRTLKMGQFKVVQCEQNFKMFVKGCFQNICQRVFGVGFVVIQSRLWLQTEYRRMRWSRLRGSGHLVSSVELAALKLYVLEEMAFLQDFSLSPW